MDTTLDSITCNVTLEEFKLFHEIDRKLYIVLVRDLLWNPSESLHIMGLWLWLEHGGSSNLIKKILSLPLNLIVTLVHEAMACLKCLDDRFPVSRIAEIPLTHHISQTEEVSLQFFHENRFTAFPRLQNLVSEVCIPAFSDLMEIARHGGFQQIPAQNQVVHPVHDAPGLLANSLLGSFSGIRIGGDARLAPSNGESRCDRTMFLTFSKGYPVSEIEVWSSFQEIHGDGCIESIHMQEVEPGEQALYAMLVFKNASYIRSILRGVNKAKYSINGKHVWMRKFIHRNGRSSP